jgi:hypothetical protein
MVLVAVCWLLNNAQAKVATIRIPLAFGNEDITFDSSLLSHDEVNRWIQLSPYVGIENNYLTPEIIDQVMGRLPREVGCGKEGGVRPLNAQVMDRIRQRIRDLDPEHYPADLSDVVLYARHLQSLGLWIDTQLLAFVKTCERAPLESEFEGIKPKLQCGAALDRIAKAKTGFEAYELARSHWASCTWQAGLKRLGQYPKSAWEHFLSAHGIREHFVPEPVD